MEKPFPDHWMIGFRSRVSLSSKIFLPNVQDLSKLSCSQQPPIHRRRCFGSYRASRHDRLLESERSNFEQKPIYEGRKPIERSVTSTLASIWPYYLMPQEAANTTTAHSVTVFFSPSNVNICAYPSRRKIDG
jgi:hypothetical protein